MTRLPKLMMLSSSFYQLAGEIASKWLEEADSTYQALSLWQSLFGERHAKLDRVETDAAA